MKPTLVTVIIPVHNTEKYIADCINSVLTQSYKNLEIIIINDGSTDGSEQICNQFTDDERVIFVNRENLGLSHTRQQGIDMAKGEFFCNLDSDDMLDSNFVEKMLSAALKTNADIVACGRKDFDNGYEQDFLLSASKDFYALDKNYVSNCFDTVAVELWLSDSWNKLYRTAFVRNSNVKYWLNNKYNGTDLSFNHLLCLHCPKIAVVNEPLLLHRIVMGSRVHRKNKPLQEGFELITEREFTEAKRLGYPDSFYERYKYSYYIFLKMVVNAIICESENTGEVRERWKKYRDSAVGFSVKYPVLSPDNLKRKQCKGFDRIIHKAMISPNVRSCIFAYRLNKLRMWKNKKR